MTKAVDQILERISWMEWEERLMVFRGICSYIGEDIALRELVEQRGGDARAVMKSLPAFSAIIEKAKAESMDVLASRDRHADAGTSRSAESRYSAGTLRIASWPGPHYQHNPFITLFCEGLAAAGAEVLDVKNPCVEPRPAASVLHIHWPDQVFWAGRGPEQTAVAAVSTLRAIARWKSDGTRIVWMVHNTEPHDLMEWQREIWTSFYRDGLARLCDGFMTLSPSTIAVVRHSITALQDKPAVSVRHPTYPGVSRSAATRSATRAQLDFPHNVKVAACLGVIRPYKGVDELVEVFRAVSDDTLRLLVAGRPVPESFGETLQQQAATDPRIRVVLSHLDDDEFCRYTAAADLIVIPLRNYLHSGSLVHAISAGRTVLTPAAPFSRDLRSEFGADLVRLYEPPLGRDELFSALATAKPSEAAGDANDAVIAGRDALNFYRQVLAE